jgi:hypothetical protein
MVLTTMKPKAVYRCFAGLLDAEGNVNSACFVDGISKLLDLRVDGASNAVRRDAALLFKAFDIDESGGLNLAEIRVGLKHLGDKIKHGKGILADTAQAMHDDNKLLRKGVDLKALGNLARMGADVVWKGLSAYLDERGEVGPAHFIVAMAELAGVPPEDRDTRDVIAKLFDVFDADGSGGIDSNEVVEGLIYVSNWISDSGTIEMREVIEDPEEAEKEERREDNYLDDPDCDENAPMRTDFSMLVSDEAGTGKGKRAMTRPRERFVNPPSTGCYHNTT